MATMQRSDMRYTIETHNLCAIFMCVLAILSLINGDGDVILSKKKSSRYNYFVRCTRRFTPGLCIDPVIAVWTFAFHQQNCTERYGCPQDWRTNRFTSHARCMRRCKPLLDLYIEILSREPRNLSAYIRSKPWNKSARRDSGEDEDSTDVEEEEEEEYDTPIIEYNLNGPAPNLDDDTIDHNDWAVTDNIDEAPMGSGLMYHDYFNH